MGRRHLLSTYFRSTDAAHYVFRTRKAVEAVQRTAAAVPDIAFAGIVALRLCGQNRRSMAESLLMICWQQHRCREYTRAHTRVKHTSAAVSAHLLILLLVQDLFERRLCVLGAIRDNQLCLAELLPPERFRPKRSRRGAHGPGTAQTASHMCPIHAASTGVLCGRGTAGSREGTGVSLADPRKYAVAGERRRRPSCALGETSVFAPACSSKGAWGVPEARALRLEGSLPDVAAPSPTPLVGASARDWRAQIDTAVTDTC